MLILSAGVENSLIIGDVEILAKLSFTTFSDCWVSGFSFEGELIEKAKSATPNTDAPVAWLTGKPLTFFEKYLLSKSTSFI